MQLKLSLYAEVWFVQVYSCGSVVLPAAPAWRDVVYYDVGRSNRCCVVLFMTVNGRKGFESVVNNNNQHICI